jgi:serine/threonine protein kinase
VGHTDSVDWWSLGVMLFRMLAGTSPFYKEGACCTHLVLHMHCGDADACGDAARSVAGQ